MTTTMEFHMPAVVIFHHDGGFSRVKLLGTGGAWGDGDVPYWDIPTACVPLELRKLGSKLIVHCTAQQPEEEDSEETVRAHLRDYVVEALSEAEEKKLRDTPPTYWARQVDWPPKKK